MPVNVLISEVPQADNKLPLYNMPQADVAFTLHQI